MDKWIAIKLLQNNIRQFIAQHYIKYQLREPSFANIENTSSNISLFSKNLEMLKILRLNIYFKK